MTRLLCTGDLHLDHGATYGREPGDRLREQEAVWRQTLELARDRDCDAVLFAGDAFEKRRPSPEAMLAFERPLVDHRDNGGPPVVAIPGNHDRSGVVAGYGLQVFAEAGLIHLASEPTLLGLADRCVGPPSMPGSLAVACLPWTPVAHLVAGRDGGDRDLIHHDAALILLDVARDLRGQVEGPCVLLTHFSISGASTPDGLDVGMFREPVLPVDDLDGLGFNAIVAGHIHRPQKLLCTGGKQNLYVGSPMPLTFGEAFCEHGVWLLDIDGLTETRFVPIASRRFVTVDVDLAAMEADGIDALRELDDALGEPDVWRAPIAGRSDVSDAIVKVRIRAGEEHARAIDVPRIRRTLEEAGAYKVWQIQVDVDRPDRVRVEGLDESVDDEQAFELWLDAQGVSGSRAARLVELNKTYLEEAR